MGMEYYIFALFIFGLVALLVLLLLRGMKRNREKEEEEINEKEKKVMMLYFEVEDMIEAFKQYVESSRENMENNVKRIETDMQALSTLKNGLGYIQEEHERLAKEIFPNQAMQQVNILVGEDEKVLDEVEEIPIENEDEGSMAKRLNISRTEAGLMKRLKIYDKS